jgi:hypothetical protein
MKLGLGAGEQKKLNTTALEHNHVPTSNNFFFVIPFYLQSVLVHSENCAKPCIQWHVEECSVATLIGSKPLVAITLTSVSLQQRICKNK